ncbi:hypothetical protein Pyn_09630 [Prunus yedoensis var. nudiflora]|uniref:Uncharacterized protein n=1 Tax=Prunus yedoensis var. nudiflora TaxID=2094558 RepID=A0A314YP78_PRUYE|nr:hypothetical protein Pyn_09630 [Prunus yedoensis var. nudiflora]
MSHVICTTLGSMEKYGIGMIVPSNIYRFYDDLQSYLASCNVDGVKVDVQNVLELLGSGYGAHVALMRRSKQGAATRVSEDFMPMEPTFQTLHVAAVAFNSLLMREGQFQSDHYTAKFHAAARALGGCPVYVRSVTS